MLGRADCNLKSKSLRDNQKEAVNNDAKSVALVLCRHYGILNAFTVYVYYDNLFFCGCYIPEAILYNIIIEQGSSYGYATLRL